MTLQILDRIKATTSTTGTGTWTMGAAVTGFQAFSVVGNGNTVYYSAWDGAGNWEIGLGTYTSSGTTLARTTILASSNSNAAVNFTNTPITVWGDRPAVMDTLPTFQTLTSGTTYTTPAGVRQIRIRMVGGGGGGGGSGTSTNNGGIGVKSSFNSYDAAPGSVGTGGGVGSLSGNGSNGSGAAYVRRIQGVGGSGAAASSATSAAVGGTGGSTPFGGGGGSDSGAPPPNSGAGGGGGGLGTLASGQSAGGGGAAEYVELVFNNPAASYTYAIGTGGGAGSAGASGFAGAAGAAGRIEVEEIYGS